MVGLLGQCHVIMEWALTLACLYNVRLRAHLSMCVGGFLVHLYASYRI